MKALAPGPVGDLKPLTEEALDAIATSVANSKSTARQRSDAKEEVFKAARDAAPEATLVEKPLEFLRDRTPHPETWEAVVTSDHLRSWLFVSHERGITWRDFEELQQKVEWHDLQNEAGTPVRRTTWFTKEGCKCPYHYGRERVEANPFPPWFDAMMRRWLWSLHLTDSAECPLPNCVNLNLYENGNHNVSWHADDEPLFSGKHQDIRIVSVSLGSPRRFQVGLRAPRRGGILLPERGSIQSVTLGHGHLCTMDGLFQKHYIHQVAKSKAKTLQPRINATFRWIVEHSVECPLAVTATEVADSECPGARRIRGRGRGK